MTFQKFKLKPSEAGNYLEEYRNSVFSLPAAPEYAQGETCLASVIRNVGSDVPEKDIYTRNSLVGSKVRDSIESRLSSFESNNGITQSILTILSSPMPAGSQKNPRDYLNLYPLVPAFSYVSNSSRFTEKSWVPGEYLKGMLASTCQSFESYRNSWGKIFELLSVSEADDIWARTITRLLSGLEEAGHEFKWALREVDEKVYVRFSNKLTSRAFESSPACVLTQSLDKLSALKGVTTRRQWISVFESLLRISMGMHVVWTCKLNSKLWSIIWSSDKEVSSESLTRELFEDFESLILDMPSDPQLRDICAEYSVARVSINYVLHYFLLHHNISPPSFNCMASLSKWICAIRGQLKESFTKDIVSDELLAIYQRNTKLYQGTSGFSNNIFEYLKHSLGQKTTEEMEKRSFDQGYWCQKQGSARNAKWLMSFGPVTVITLVSLALPSGYGTASDIVSFLAKLGFKLNADKLLETSFGQSLVDLGLTGDNPDGERGVVVLNPFF
ncbi:MAG: hypothetical protein WBP58_01045 [Chitinophagaceae bacterium]